MEGVQPTALAFLICFIQIVSPYLTTMAPVPGDWTIRDDAGKVCMRMTFAAQYTVTDDYPTPVHVHIDPSKATLKSDCSYPHRVLTIYNNYDEDIDWQLQLTFVEASREYRMTTVFASWLNYYGTFNDDQVQKDNFFQKSVSLGEAYTCTQSLNVDLGDATVQILNMQLQPFAEYSNGDYGPSEDCQDAPPTSNNTLVIALSVVGGVLFLAFVVVVVAVFAVVISRRRRYAPIQ